MFLHNIKLALRNLQKYKTQNIISILGLAVGFICFAFSALWIRYELSYDSFHENADRIYRVHTDLQKWENASASDIYDTNPYPLAEWLKSQFPEVEDASGIQYHRRLDENIKCIYVDKSFCNIFKLPIDESFFIEGRDDRPAVVAKELLGYEKLIKENYNFDVIQSLSAWQSNTNISFNMVIPVNLSDDDMWDKWWFYGIHHIYILLAKGVDIKSFEEKLDSVRVPEWPKPISLVITPITKLRHNNPSGNLASDIKFAHIQTFALAGLLVILCSLFNHLTLYVTRIRISLRELALRKVNGATNWQIASLLYTDFLLVILFSLIIAFPLMMYLLPIFKEYASIDNTNIVIYYELAIYSFCLIICGLLVCGITVLYFRGQHLNQTIKISNIVGSKNIFRKLSLGTQLVIGLTMMLCASIFIKQINFLHTTDLGINRHNVVAVQASCCPLNSPHYAQQIKQISGIDDAISIGSRFFLRNMISGSNSFDFERDGQSITYTIYNIFADPHFFDFFGISIIEGTTHHVTERNRVFNQTAMDAAGDYLRRRHSFAGASQDFYLTPTIKALPTGIGMHPRGHEAFSAVAYRYQDGLRQHTQDAVTKWYRDAFPDQGEFEVNFDYMEEIYSEHFKSERALFMLLSIMTLVCILIAIFGVYSLTSLTCQQRRKEIAIRKVHGALLVDIMNIFFKEYLILLAIAALLAFPAGYLIMKRWMENYVKQTSIDAWIYIAIFLTVFVVIVLTIFSMVWAAARRNPAEVVKAD